MVASYDPLDATSEARSSTATPEKVACTRRVDEFRQPFLRSDNTDTSFGTGGGRTLGKHWLRTHPTSASDAPLLDSRRRKQSSSRVPFHPTCFKSTRTERVRDTRYFVSFTLKNCRLKTHFTECPRSQSAESPQTRNSESQIKAPPSISMSTYRSPVKQANPVLTYIHAYLLCL
jgi:hypothetical protein